MTTRPRRWPLLAGAGLAALYVGAGLAGKAPIPAPPAGESGPAGGAPYSSFGLLTAAPQAYRRQGEPGRAREVDDIGAPATAAARASPRLSDRQVLALADRCAPTTPGSVLLSIVRVESGKDPNRIGVNGKDRRSLAPRSKAAAAEAAAQLLAGGENIDLGLAQINSRNLAWLGLTAEQALDPCRNLAAAGKIIERGYAQALRAAPRKQPLLQTAYSLYNTGDLSRGFTNGYVGKVVAAGR
jgi:type IV secretion system protein VirB1